MFTLITKGKTMRVEIHIAEEEYHDLLDHIPIHSDGTKYREDLARLASERCNIPFESLQCVIYDTDAWSIVIWPREGEK